METIIFEQNLDLKPSITIEDEFPLTRRQGSASSCTCFAVVSAVEYILKQSRVLNQECILSERFLYYMTRELSGETPTQDLGCYIEKALEAAKTYGIATEEMCPYYSSKFSSFFGYGNITEAPSRDARKEALKYRISTASQIIPTIYQLKVALQAKFPVVGVIRFSDSTFSLRASWFTGVARKTPHPPKYAHAVVFVGYDDIKQRFKFRNTWDDFVMHWGDHGYGYIPYELVDSLISSAFIISSVASIKQQKCYLISLQSYLTGPKFEVFESK